MPGTVIHHQPRVNNWCLAPITFTGAAEHVGVLSRRIERVVVLAAVACALAATVGAAPARAMRCHRARHWGNHVGPLVVDGGAERKPTTTNLQWPCMTAGTNTTQTGVEACTGTPDAVGSG